MLCRMQIYYNFAVHDTLKEKNIIFVVRKNNRKHTGCFLFDRSDS